MFFASRVPFVPHPCARPGKYHFAMGKQAFSIFFFWNLGDWIQKRFLGCLEKALVFPYQISKKQNLQNHRIRNAPNCFYSKEKQHFPNPKDGLRNPIIWWANVHFLLLYKRFRAIRITWFFQWSEAAPNAGNLNVFQSLVKLLFAKQHAKTQNNKN